MKTEQRKKFLRELLTATCLTAVSAGAAQAATVTETTDFGNTFGTATVLPVGTDVVNGTVTTVTDVNDFFKFIGLLPGGSFSLSFVGSGANYALFTSSGSSLGSGAGSVTIPGTIPGDGILVAQASYFESGPYTATLTAPLASAPEPASMALTGLGVALAAALNRRRKRTE